MQNDYLDTQILLHEEELQTSLRTTISGKLTFTAKIDFSIEEPDYQAVIIAKNKYSTKEIPLNKTT